MNAASVRLLSARKPRWRHCCVRAFGVSEALTGAVGWVATTRLAHAAETVLLFSHDSLELPWWAAVCATAAAVRVVSLPTAFFFERLRSRQLLVAPAVHDELREALARRRLAPDQLSKQFRRRMKARAGEAGAENLISRSLIGGLVPASLWICSTVSLRTMITRPAGSEGAICEQFAAEGTLWFPNLMQLDPLYMLPFGMFMCVVFTAQLMKIPVPPNTHPLVRFNAHMKHHMWVAIAFVWLPISCNMPAGLVLFWFVNAIFSLLQTSIFTSARCRAMLGLAAIDDASQTVVQNRR